MSDPTLTREITTLAEALLDFARDMLRRHRQFYPFGATIDAAGAVTMVSGDLGHPWAGGDELAGLLYEELTRRAAAGDDAVRAAGVCRESDKMVEVQVEHRSGPAMALILPYRLRRKAVEFGTVTPSEGRRRIFVSPG
ncbi:MAG: hypothetical protein QOG64_1902 [Acidimicrobiaceae bacterium]|jgi:hypothetical protein|nr:hypothetical protein [Acidimicrobiaceae bacterium]